ncbi:High affinity cAMP-specific and IBMX-insensitive 3',5'-cyclic phosphodiesterase 9A [Entophlyctis sp. JEL0112]|nr:High affinity cAMP-specific and IBMX-insensitive 3',5'-cyclic phosphodiesterase 9A [Entophlyctis sp. JEL0112]
MPIVSQIYVKVNNSPKLEAIRIRPNHTPKEILSALCAAAEVSDQGTPWCEAVLKLYSSSKSLVPIGPNIPKNSANTPYNLEVILVPKVPNDDTKQMDVFLKKLKATTTILEDMPKLMKDVEEIEKKIRSSHSAGRAEAAIGFQLPQDCEIYSVPSSIIPSDPTTHLALTRASTYNDKRLKEIMGTSRPVFSAAITEHLKHPTFNIWDYNDNELIGLMESMFIELDVVKTFNINLDVIRRFLARRPKLNILATLTESQYRDCRKQIINCILATDMAKHGEILAKFKSYSAEFNFEEQAQRQLMIIKSSDISNEVRPKHVSEPWVDNLLEEFFCQSDKEKKEGLPTAPFMDREKVTKPSAQVGFIGFVMIPLFELVSKVLPNMDEPIIQPIRRAHEYYKSMLETKPGAVNVSVHTLDEPTYKSNI